MLFIFGSAVIYTKFITMNVEDEMGLTGLTDFIWMILYRSPQNGVNKHSITDATLVVLSLIIGFGATLFHTTFIYYTM